MPKYNDNKDYNNQTRHNYTNNIVIKSPSIPAKKQECSISAISADILVYIPTPTLVITQIGTTIHLSW